jgi:hypothetical protein
MGWMHLWRSSREAEWADSLDETVINSSQHDPRRAGASSAAGFGPDAEIPEEIKRRQTSLMVSYIMALRAR